MRPKIGFYLMGLKGLKTLQAYLRKFHAGSIAFVVGSRDKAVEQDYHGEIRDLCAQHQVPFYDRNAHEGVSADYRFAIGWRWLVPDAKRLIVLHDSLLPRYRGFAPLVNSLINGEKQIGVTALFAGASYDSGPLVGQRSVDVQYPVKIAAAIEALLPAYSELVISITTKLFNDESLEAVEQDHSKASYSLWRNEDDYQIDWGLSAAKIRRSIDALGFPYRGASTWNGTQKYRILEAEEVENVLIENRDPGKVLFTNGNSPVVVCGAGLLRLTKVVDDISGQDVLPIQRLRTRFR